MKSYKTFPYTEIPGWRGKPDSKYCGFIRIHFIGYLPACAQNHLISNLTGISNHTCTFLSNKISLRTHFNIITLHLFNPEKKLAISSKSLSPPQFCYFSNHGNLLLWLFYYFGFGKIKMTNKLKQTWLLTLNCDCLRLMRSAWSFT